MSEDAVDPGSEADEPNEADDAVEAPSKFGERLFPEHAEVLRVRGITPEIAAARGYSTYDNAVAVQRDGFSQGQAQAVVKTRQKLFAMRIPLWWGERDADGNPVASRARGNMCQVRPDLPGIGPKYASQAKIAKGGVGDGIHLDAPPLSWPHVMDPDAPLIITEGPLKGDAICAAALKESIDIGIISICGVTMWRNIGTEWMALPLRGRKVLIAFDSDAVTKTAVHREMAALADFLTEKQGAVVEFVLLPHTDADKTGIDDYLTSGKSLKSILDDLVSHDLPEAPVGAGDVAALEGPKIFVDEDTLSVIKTSFNKTIGATQTERLTNWVARITGVIVPRDAAHAQSLSADGEESKVRYRIEASTIRNGETYTTEATIDADKFDRPEWLRANLGMLANVEVPPTTTTRGEAVNAMRNWRADEQYHEEEWGHTGWVPAAGVGWAFVTGNSAIGPRGTTDEVNASIPSNLSRFELPDIGPGTSSDEIEDAIEASMSTYGLFNRSQFFYALIGSVYSSVTPFRHPRISLMMLGLPKSGKTWVCGNVVLAHFGDWATGDMPGNFESTANFNEGLANKGANLPMVFDDLARTGSKSKAEQQATAFAALVRGAWNHAGRGRMKADGSLRAMMPPRCLPIVTAEHMPNEASSMSLQERMFVLEFIGPDRGKTPTLPKEAVSSWQYSPEQDKLPTAMAGFLYWWAKRMNDSDGKPSKALSEKLKEDIEATVAKLENEAFELSAGRDRRAAKGVAELAIGWHYFSMWLAEEHPVLAKKYGDRLSTTTVLKQLVSLAATNETRREANAAPTRFFEALATYLSSGKGYLATADDRPPKGYEIQCGWSRRQDDDSYEPVWEKRGERLGIWLEERDGDGNQLVGFDSGAAWTAVTRVEGEFAHSSRSSMWEELNHAGDIVMDIGSANGKYGRRIAISDEQRPTLHVFRAKRIFDAGEEIAATQDDDQLFAPTG